MAPPIGLEPMTCGDVSTVSRTIPFFLFFKSPLGDVPKCWIRSALLWNCLLCCEPTNQGARHYFIIDCTLPTLPSISRTLIPWGWVELLVRTFLTMPSVNLPFRWSCFKTIFTRIPGLIWLLCWLGCISNNRCFAAYSVFALLIQNDELVPRAKSERARRMFSSHDKRY